jgi:hypothetical protein
LRVLKGLKGFHPTSLKILFVEMPHCYKNCRFKFHPQWVNIPIRFVTEILIKKGDFVKEYGGIYA